MDIDFLLFLQDFRKTTNSLFDSFFLYITTLAEGITPVIIAALVYWCINKKAGCISLLTYGIGSALNGLLKITACVYRPWIRDSRVVPVSSAMSGATGYSFPSGHTTNAATVFGSLATEKKASKTLRVLLIMLVLLVGFSRNYLGVHTPQDVIVAVLSTAALIAVIRFLEKVLRENKNFDIIYVITVLAFLVFICAFANNKSYPLDYGKNGNLIVDPAVMVTDTYKGVGRALGVIIGWILERRFVKYEIDGNASAKASRFILGMLGYLLISYAFVKLLPGTMAGIILKQFFGMFYVVFIAPLLFKMFQKRN